MAFTTWTLVHASGIHATVAGVLLGLVVPVKPRATVPSISTLPAEVDVAQRFEHRLRPLSAGFAVPVFAFFASGVTVIGGGLGEALLRESFALFAERGKRAAGLGVDAENTTGAVALYERVGMHVVRRSDTWERTA